MQTAYLTVLVRAELEEFAPAMADFAAAKGNLAVCLLDARGDETLPAGCIALTPQSLLGGAYKHQAFLLDIGGFSVLCRLAGVQRLLQNAPCACVVQPQWLSYVAGRPETLELQPSTLALWRDWEDEVPITFVLGTSGSADERCLAFCAGESMDKYLAWARRKIEYIEHKMNALNRSGDHFPFIENQWAFLSTWTAYASELGCASAALPWPAPRRPKRQEDKKKPVPPRYENDYFDNGVKILPLLRDFYARDYRLRENCKGDPFAHAALFLDHSAVTGDVHPVPLTVPMMALYQTRADLPRTFVRLDGDWRMPFVKWYLEHAQQECKLPDAYLDTVRAAYEPYQAALQANAGDRRPWGERLATRLKIILGGDAAPAAPVYDYPKGVNLCGFVKGEFGLGEATRILADILQASGIPFTIVDFQGPLEQSFADATWDARIENKFIYNTNLILTNADGLPNFVEGVDKMALEGRYNIGFWYWELPEFPDKMAESFQYVDEVWTASEFTVESFEKKSGGKPVKCIPCSIRAEADESLSRRDFGIPEDRFVFLQMYDVRSSQARKNPKAAVDAFLEAFGDRTDVLLVLKLNLPEYSREADGVLALARAHQNIMTLVGNYPKAKINALCRCCDAYVSLHRSEGFGLGPAEAMYWGRPAVLTNWSGNTVYMRPDNCCPVEARVIEIEKAWGPYEKGWHWADPDVHDAARWMKKLVDEPEFYQKLSAGAYRTIREEFSPEAIGKLLKKRLEELGQL